MGNAKLLDNSNVPNINILTKKLFIDFSPWYAKITNCQFYCSFSIAYNPLALLGISEYGTDFSQNGNLEEGDLRAVH